MSCYIYTTLLLQTLTEKNQRQVHNKKFLAYIIKAGLQYINFSIPFLFIKIGLISLTFLGGLSPLVW